MSEDWTNVMLDAGFVKTWEGLWVPSEDLPKARKAADEEEEEEEEEEFDNELKGAVVLLGTELEETSHKLDEYLVGSTLWAARKVKGRRLTKSAKRALQV